MNRLVGLVAAFLATGVAAALAASCSLGSRTYRYRMTVEVQTPEGTKTGIAVREIMLVPQPGMTGNEFTTKQRGGAVAVDIADGQTLFALLDERGFETVAAGFGRGTAMDLMSALNRAERDREVYILALNDDVPRLARFRRPDDPLSVERVEPDDLESRFGPAVRLKRISVQMTDDPVTTDVIERLNWLKTHPEPRLDASYQGPISSTAAQQLAHGDFQRGLK